MLKTVVSLAAIASLYYQKKCIEKPKVFHHPDSLHLDYLNNSPLLKKPYKVTPWLTNPHAQIIYYSIKKSKLAPNADIQLENIIMPDGAITQLAWLNHDIAPDAPTIVILHTITGSPQSMQTMLEDLRQFTGWRIVMCLRRGHTLDQQPFTQINIMGSVPDLQVQLAHIEKKFPDSALYALGSSAGTALLARYLGDVGQATPFKAAFAYAPGYDLTKAFDRIAPFYNRYMAKKIKRVFFQPHQQHLSAHPSYQALLKTKKLSELQKQLYHFAGFESYAAYLNHCNPILVFDQIKIPTMILNAEGDPICHIQNAQQNLNFIESNVYLALVTTKHGSHCMHYQGWRPQSWAHQLIAEYFLHQHRLQ